MSPESAVITGPESVWDCGSGFWIAPRAAACFERVSAAETAADSWKRVWVDRLTLTGWPG